jgi:Mg2+-importing ATPase
MLLHADVATFRTGWFVESVVSAAMIVLVVRTRGRLWKSRPARALWLATLLMVVLTLSIPLTPLGALFGFVPLPPIFYLILGALVLGYAGCAEVAKAWFYRTAPPGRPSPGIPAS